MNGAVQLITTVKAAPQGDRRILTGVASSTLEDRMGDVVLPRGLKYQLPFPILLFHDHALPVGRVTSATVTDTDFRITAEIARDVGRANEAWDLVTQQLVTSLSIGFRGLTHEPNGQRGLRWTSAELLEISLVSIPANPAAKITSIAGKSLLAGTGVKLIVPSAGAVKLIRGNR